MRDPIERQAAIDALDKNHILGQGLLNDILDHIADAISALPSAQPEPEWIPCSEKLPENDKDVLVTRQYLSDKQLKKNAITETFYVEVASRMDDEWTSYSDEYKIKRHLHKVIAWMPLPEKYHDPL